MTDSTRGEGRDEEFVPAPTPSEILDDVSTDFGSKPILTRSLYVLAMLLLIALLGTVVLQVIARIVGLSVPWTEELGRYFLLWLTFTGAWIGVREREHFSAGFLEGKLGAAGRWAVGVVSALALLLLLAGCIMTIGQIGGTPTPILGWPTAVIYAPVAVATACMAIDVLFVRPTTVPASPAGTGTE